MIRAPVGVHVPNPTKVRLDNVRKMLDTPHSHKLPNDLYQGDKTMGLAADILDLFHGHTEELTAAQKRELIVKFEKRKDDLEKALEAVKHGLAVLGAAPTKRRPRRKAVKRRTKRSGSSRR
jgi:hypothetical protein